MTEREKFEAWATQPENNFDIRRYSRDTHGSAIEYLDNETEDRWQGWHARALSVEEGCTEADAREGMGRAMPVQWHKIDYSKPETWPDPQRRCVIRYSDQKGRYETDACLFRFYQSDVDSSELSHAYLNGKQYDWRYEDGDWLEQAPDYWCYAPLFNGDDNLRAD